MNTEFSIFCPYLLHVNIDDNDHTITSTTTQLVDFDANLFHKDVDFVTATQRAQEKGVQSFVVPGSTLCDSEKALAAAEKYSCILAATAGVHPYNTESIVLNEENIQTLRHLLSSPYCLAVGECGLDFSDGFPSTSSQMDWFRLQVALAIEYKKPLYLHIRDSYQCFAKLLEEETVGGLMTAVNAKTCATPEWDQQLSLVDYFKAGNGRNVVIHCFTGSLEELQYYVDLGCFIGLTGHVFSLPVQTVQQILHIIPLSKLVIETDAPYMGFKGCREGEDKAKSRKYPNVPAALPKIATYIAEILKMSYDELCAVTTRNAHSFFETRMQK